MVTGGPLAHTRCPALSRRASYVVLRLLPQHATFSLLCVVVNHYHSDSSISPSFPEQILDARTFYLGWLNFFLEEGVHDRLFPRAPIVWRSINDNGYTITAVSPVPPPPKVLQLRIIQSRDGSLQG